MNELMRDFLSKIIVVEARKKPQNTTPREPEHKVGDVWQPINPTTKQKSSTWSAKRADGPGGTRGGFDSEESARRWLSGKGKVPGQEEPTGETPEELPPEVIRVTPPERLRGGGRSGRARPRPELTPADAERQRDVGIEKLSDAPAVDALFPNEDKRGRAALLKGMDTSRKVASGEGGGKTTPEQRRNAEAFSVDMASLLALKAKYDTETDQAKKQKIKEQMTALAQKMKDTYQLYSDSTGRQFKGENHIFGKDNRKICGSTGTRLPVMMVGIFKECGISLVAEGRKRESIKNDLTTASKPDLGDVRGEDVDGVSGVFDSFGRPIPSRYRRLFGPTEIGPDGNPRLVPNTGGKAARAWLGHSVEQQRQTLQSLAEIYERSGNAGSAAAVREYEREMDAVMETGPWPEPDTPEARAEREQKVKDAFAKLTVALADPSVGGNAELAAAALKNVGEVFLYQRELARGDEAYLPAAGNFPVADKIRITRDGSGRMERIQRISIKWGENSSGIAGFPAQGDGYVALDDDPFYSGDCNQGKKPCVPTLTDSKPGSKGHSIGVRDDVAIDPTGVQRLADDSQVSPPMSKKDSAALAQANKRLVDCVNKNRSDPPGLAVKACQDKHGKEARTAIFGSDMKCKKGAKGGEICSCTTDACRKREAALRASLGNDAVDTMIGDPAMATAVLATMAVVRRNNGFENVEHCSMRIEKGAKASKKAGTPASPPQFKDKCVTGNLDDMNCWRVDVRYADPRAGGVRLAYGCPPKADAPSTPTPSPTPPKKKAAKKKTSRGR